MEKFPNLSGNQVALLRAEFSTGHVLDEQFNLVTNANQKVYSVFNSLKEAEDFTRKILFEREDIEVIIYNLNQEVLNYWKPEYKP